MGLFDSPTHLLIILAVLVVLFGSAKLPKAAKSMGEAMRIFKKESAKLHEDAPTAEVPVSAPQQVAAPQPQASQEQIAALKQQMDALQQQMAPQPTVAQPAQPGTTLPETQHTNQPS
jgi:sec-independent protein translocase protein TatA